MLIFLDIDGVMVPAKGWKIPELLEDGFPCFSVAATQVLQKIMSEQTTLVLTSSHKSNYTLEEWKNIFSRRGIVVQRLKSLDKNVNHLNRKDEVLNWFATQPVDQNFVILDDDKSLNALPSHLKDHLVLTSSLIGLSEEHLVQIEAVLKMDVQVAWFTKFSGFYLSPYLTCDIPAQILHSCLPLTKSPILFSPPPTPTPLTPPNTV